jgi:predicted hydrocarbon binding protein
MQLSVKHSNALSNLFNLKICTMFDIRKIQEPAIFQAIKNESNDETASEIVYGQNQSEVESDPAWVKNTMRRLENRFSPEKVKTIRMNCQCGYAMDEKLKLVHDLMKGANSLEDFADNERANAVGLSLINGELHLQFPFCPCPMVAQVDKLETNTWCQCTTGYSKVLFEKAFGCPVNVELLKSIKMSDEICLMKIVPNGLIWENQG